MVKVMEENCFVSETVFVLLFGGGVLECDELL